ncbi:MAG: hypothetical protein Q8M31_00270 [Beijerinckiaceae bacterium]|nr:hypothetical protein [Beijerinckiaceae bacterium]
MTTDHLSVRAAVEAVTSHIQGIRDQISDRQAARREVDESPRSLLEVQQIIDREIEQAQSGGFFQFIGLQARTSTFNSLLFNDRFENRPFELLAAIAPDKLRAALLDGVPNDGLPPAERETLLSEMDTENFRLEVAEETAVRELEVGTGRPLARRADVNPAILVAPTHELEALSAH